MAKELLFTGRVVEAEEAWPDWPAKPPGPVGQADADSDRDRPGYRR